ncbi:hypothetical protein CFter6_5317 [Collimonas fungivorans]|uniref:Uncharacterized protein n=1 Tax=Collimonas fungivorans TaxID=158899 RepID=A0A127PJS9_9BURK|nr:hypothetical protein CFter6_5317 [Collimonas fungivorans]
MAHFQVGKYHADLMVQNDIYIFRCIGHLAFKLYKRFIRTDYFRRKDAA